MLVQNPSLLGARSILLRGKIVRGLATPASLWSVAGISLAVGGGMRTAAQGATVTIPIILAGVKPLLAHSKLRNSVRLTPQLGDDLLR